MSSAVNASAPIIFGCNGPALEADERAFFKSARPAGFILFQKNCLEPQQVMRLTAELRDCVGWNAPVLIDQEGGRVQRLKPPHWPVFPALRSFGDLYAIDEGAALAAVADNHAALAGAQVPLGIDVNCVPVLDVVPSANKVRAIDDRSFGPDVGAVSALGLSAVRASIDCGMTPVIKHMPGHGRATVDSHFDLPRVTENRDLLEQSDFLPFRHIAGGVDNDLVWGMTAHVIYTAIDADLPGTASPAVIADIIRGFIGFDGLLLTDDLFMDALKIIGDVPARARASLEAGVDLALHCHGSVAERERAVSAIPAMSAGTAGRLSAWLEKRA